jgi:hypothetical protein
MEACKPGRNDGSRCDPQRVDAKRATHLSRGLAGFGDCNGHLSKQRSYAPVEELATGRWRDASSSAIQKARADAAFQLSNGLAECRRRQPQMLCRPGEALTLHDGDECL